MTEGHEYSMHANVSLNRSYKVMELTPELLKLIEEAKEPLRIKAPSAGSDIVICTKDQTFSVRQRNHSNTVMFMKESEKLDYLCGYTKMSSVFEVHKTTGTVDIKGLPVYDGQESISHLKNTKTVDELRDSSAISEKEFDSVWFALNGSSFNGTAVILSEEFITRALHVMIMSIMAANLNVDELSLIEVYKSMEEDVDFPIDVVETVLRKFSKGGQEPFALNKTKIGQWYGIESLTKHARSKPISVSDFLFKWKSDLPPFFDCSIDLPLLIGHYVTPLPDRIQYISKNSLPSDIKNRLKHLFKLQSTWELQELVPFIEEFNTKKVKNENFIMKFARKKKVGRKILITPQ